MTENHSTTSSKRSAHAVSRSVAPRAWQRMLSGRRLDLLDPSALDVEIEDIAHGLARVARWNGQTRGAHIFSVAQHALLVESIARQREPNLDRRLRLAVLLHDAPEYVIGDMITPFKAVIGDSYRAVEARLHVAIRLRFGLPGELPNHLQRLIKLPPIPSHPVRPQTFPFNFHPATLSTFLPATSVRRGTYSSPPAGRCSFLIQPTRESLRCQTKITTA